MAVTSLIYMSKASKTTGPDEIREIVKTARAHNPREGITGLLLFADGYFLQMLEGEKLAIDNLYEAINNDRRHRGILQISRSDDAERYFPRWSMGYSNIDRDEVVKEAGYDFFTQSIEAAIPDRLPTTLALIFKRFSQPDGQRPVSKERKHELLYSHRAG